MESAKKLRFSWNWQNKDKNIFCPFFKDSLNFGVHALQLEPNKVSISNFVLITVLITEHEL